MKKLFFLLIFCSSLLGHSQVPGYMGKRFIIGYSCNFSGSFLGPTARSTSYNGSSGLVGDDLSAFTDFVGINNSHVINIDYVHHYRKTVCALVQYFRTGVDYFNIRENYYRGDPTKPAILSTLGIGLGLKSFKRSNLAPYGPYVKWEGIMFLNSIKYNNFGYATQDGFGKYVPVSKLGTGNVEFQAFALGFSWGRQRIFYDKLVLDRGVRILFVPAGFVELSNEHNGSVETEFESDGLARLFRHQFISFHLGIGFLAF